MSVYQARRWIILTSLCIAGAAFVFFIVAPTAGYPLRFSQALSILQIVFPVFLGYLGAASQFVFQKAPPKEDTVQPPPLMELMLYGPVALFLVIVTAAVAAFGFSNRAVAAPGDGMSVEQLRNAITAAMGLLAITTNVAVAYLFAVQSKSGSRPPKNS